MRIHAYTLNEVGEHGFREVDTLHVYASVESLRLLARFLTEAAADLERQPEFVTGTRAIGSTRSGLMKRSRSSCSILPSRSNQQQPTRPKRRAAERQIR